MKSKYFKIEELVSKYAYEKFGDRCWEFIDSRMIEDLDSLREQLGMAFEINNWSKGGKVDYNGFLTYRDNSVYNYIQQGTIPDTQRLYGRGFHIYVRHLSGEQLLEVMREKGITYKFANFIRVPIDRSCVEISHKNEA